MTLILWLLILMLLVFLIGYMVGKKRGIRIGREAGLAESKIMLRAESYRFGICPICDHEERGVNE